MFYCFSFLLNLYRLNDCTEVDCHLKIVGIYLWSSNSLHFTVSFSQRVLRLVFELITVWRQKLWYQKILKPPTFFASIYQKTNFLKGFKKFLLAFDLWQMSFMRDKLYLDPSFIEYQRKQSRWILYTMSSQTINFSTLVRDWKHAYL